MGGLRVFVGGASYVLLSMAACRRQRAAIMPPCDGRQAVEWSVREVVVVPGSLSCRWWSGIWSND